MMGRPIDIDVDLILITSDHPADIEYAKDKSVGVKSGDGKVVSPRAVNGKQSKVKPNKYEMQVGGG